LQQNNSIVNKEDLVLMKRKAIAMTLTIALLFFTVAGTKATDLNEGSSQSILKMDDSWVANATQLLEEAKPYPEWNIDYGINAYMFWLYENGSDQFVGAKGTNNTDSLGTFLEMVLSEANTRTIYSISESDMDSMLEANRVLNAYFRMGYEFPALNNHVWNVYFVLDDGLNQGLKGTIFVGKDVYGSEQGTGNWSGWKLTPFPTTQEPFPTILVAGVIIAVAIVVIGLLVYFKKRKH
jgi:hypothetical protein